ncbi:MAG: septum formation initiator family protein [Fibrobacterota bacterium]
MKFLRPPGAGKNSPKKFLIWGAAALLLWLLYAVFLGGNSGFIKMYKVKKENGRLIREIDSVKTLLEERRVLLKRYMEKDPELIEKEAREKWGMAASEEKVIKFIDSGEKEK